MAGKQGVPSHCTLVAEIGGLKQNCHICCERSSHLLSLTFSLATSLTHILSTGCRLNNRLQLLNENNILFVSTSTSKTAIIMSKIRFMSMYLLTDIEVPTIDNVRNSQLLGDLLLNENNVLCVGPTGTGKTVTIMSKLSRNMPKQFIADFINFSARTSSNQTQVQSCVYNLGFLDLVQGSRAIKRFFIYLLCHYK